MKMGFFGGLQKGISGTHVFIRCCAVRDTRREGAGERGFCEVGMVGRTIEDFYYVYMYLSIYVYSIVSFFPFSLHLSFPFFVFLLHKFWSSWAIEERERERDRKMSWVWCGLFFVDGVPMFSSFLVHLCV